MDGSAMVKLRVVHYQGPRQSLHRPPLGCEDGFAPEGLSAVCVTAYFSRGD